MRIVGARLGAAIRYPESHGDNWSSTWADDDLLYSVSDDTRGFDRACSSNLAIHTQAFEPAGWYNPSIPSKYCSCLTDTFEQLLKHLFFHRYSSSTIFRRARS